MLFRSKGREEGMKKGREEGMKKGREEEKLAIAKSMLSKGLDVALIGELTGLSSRELEKLQKISSN